MATASTTPQCAIGSRNNDGVRVDAIINVNDHQFRPRDNVLVGGFIREAQAQLHQNANEENERGAEVQISNSRNTISPLIEYLCLMYFEIDRFDTASIGASMELQLNEHKVTMTTDKPESAYLRHIIDSRCRRYTWNLRLNRLGFAHYWTTTIGIYKCHKATSNGSKPPRTNGIFTIDGEFPNDPNGIGNVAYGFAANKGTLVEPDSGSGADGENAKRYGQRCGTGDVVEMMLNFETLELSFIINGTPYGCAFAVEDTEYRAAVNLCQEGDSIQIMK